MADKAASPVKAKAPAGGRRGGTVLIILGTVLTVAALPLFLLFAAGMAPAAIAALVDTHPRRYLARAVAATNLAGMVVPVLALYDIGVNLPGAQHVLSDPQMWLIMYGAAALGWLLDFFMPAVARVIIDMRADQLQSQLEQRAAQLVKEWGEEVGPG